MHDIENDPTRAANENEDNEDKPRPPTQTKAATAYEILNKLDRWRSPTGREYANVEGAAVPMRRSEQLRKYVSHKFFEVTRETISKAAIEEAVFAVSGQPHETREVHVRIGGDQQRIVFDLAHDGLAAVIDANGVTVEKTDVAFFRPAGTALVQIADVTRFDINDAVHAFDAFFSLLGIADLQTRAATTAFMVQAVRPKGPFAMLLLRGPQGGGKTTVARELRRVLDPRAPEDVELPRNNRHLAILAENTNLISFDNVSVIDQRVSDACCRLATGAGFVTRALGTDRDLAAFLAARPLLFTSIGDVGVAPDLLDRALLVTLPTRTKRLSEAVLSAQFDELRPRLVAAVLFAVHTAIKNVDQVEVPGEIRMLDAARFAVAAETATGLPAGSIVQAFMASRSDAALVTSLDSVVTRTLEILPAGVPRWSGSLEDLLDKLHGTDGSSRKRAVKDLPGNARALRDRLDRVSGSLKHFGVTVDLTQLHPKTRTRIVVLTRHGASHAQNGHASAAPAS